MNPNNIQVYIPMLSIYIFTLHFKFTVQGP